jgi:RNA polymerase sigma-B factor
LLPFAGWLAGRYRNTGEPAADLEQVARLGLVKAVDRYDPRTRVVHRVRRRHGNR